MKFINAKTANKLSNRNDSNTLEEILGTILYNIGNYKLN